MPDVIDYGGQDKWRQKVTDLLNQGGGGGLVDDVKVNGTSVVDANKVAQIDLTPYAETANLATVATSGDYDDLSNKPTIPAAQVQSDYAQTNTSAVDYIKNKPTIPTVNDGTLTVKNGDQTKGTFTANQSSASNIVVLPFDIVGDLTTGFTPIYPS